MNDYEQIRYEQEAHKKYTLSLKRMLNDILDDNIKLYEENAKLREDGYKKAIHDISKLFANDMGDEPCNYNDYEEYMLSFGDWCENHCGKCPPVVCWEKFFIEKLKELRDEK